MYYNQYLGTIWEWPIYHANLGIRFTAKIVEQSYGNQSSTLEWECYGIVKSGTSTGSGIFSKIVIKATIDGRTSTIFSKTTATTVTKDEEVYLGKGTLTVPHSGSATGACDFTFALADNTASTLTDYRGLICRDIGEVAYIRGDIKRNILESEASSFKIIIPKAENIGLVRVKIPTQTTSGGTGILWEDSLVIETEGTHEFTVSFTDEQKQLIYYNLNSVFWHSDFMGFDEQLAYPTFFYIETYRLGEDTPIEDSSSYTRVPICIGVSDSAPIFNQDIKDINSRTNEATGSNRVFVQYVSTAQVTVNAEAQKGATLESYRVENGNRAIANTNVAVFENMNSDTFRFYATDNRGQTGTKTVRVALVPYLPLTCRIQSNVPTGEGNLTLVVNGNYWDGTFGSKDNSMTVYYRFKVQGNEEWGDWQPISQIEYDEEAQTYKATTLVSGLNYQSTYIFQAYAEDVVLTVYSAERQIATLPVFDWSKTDFNFNVPVSIMGKTIGGANTLLWQGSNAMGSMDYINLAEPISNQMHGIVLVFSGTSGDVSWSTHFVPKMMVEINQGGGQLFLMGINSGLSSFGAKYLYIEDDVISGQETNVSSGTSASNIIFKNENYVLRYVIGV